MQATGHAVSQHKLESNAMLGATYHNSAVWHDGETVRNKLQHLVFVCSGTPLSTLLLCWYVKVD